MSQSPRLFINEFLAANQQTISDSNGEYDDWIEIYNGEDFNINLSSYYLTDELINPMQWAFPNVSIPAKGFLLIWADNNLNQSDLHANFKLSKEGEQIGLYNGMTFVDSITYGPQYTDVSYGRRSDDNPTWVFFESPYNPPTPGASNLYVNMVTLEPPVFSPDDGFYGGSILVELTSNDPEAQIHYTLDGSVPMTSDPLYSGPITISNPTTIRAICYNQNQPGNEQMSEVVTKCYLVNIDNAMPLIDIACDSGEHDDIYNWPQPGESHPSISAHFKYFDADHVLQDDLSIALSMRGGFSLLSPKKSYQIDFTRQNFQYDLFDMDYSYSHSTGLSASFHSLNLNGMAADYSLIRNYLSYQLLRNAGVNSPQVAFARLFINGNDRGIYILMERIDNWFVKNRFGNYNYDIIKTSIEHNCTLTMDNENGQYFESKEGDFNAFNDFLDWLNAGSHSYDELKAKLDIASFLYYDLMCRFSNNKDSYDINYYLIRNRDGIESKWIILLWDTDESFGWDSIVAGDWFPYNEAFYQLRSTEEYVQLYQNTLADLMNTTWSQPAINNLVEKMENVFQTDNPADEIMWNESWYRYADGVIPGFTEDLNYNPLSRYNQFSYIKAWVGERIDYEFGLWSDGTAFLTIDPPTGGEGSIDLNSLQLTNFPWTRTYFKEIPIILKAIPGPGCLFVGWSDSSVSQTAEISITLHDDYSIHPIFQLNTQIDQVVINEINYNSAPDFNPEDWVELYNPSDQKLNISGWHLKDDDNAHDFVLPTGITIDPYDFLVISRDTTAFRRLFPKVTHYLGNMNFGLGRGGDQVRVFNSLALLIDSVAYDDSSPWTDLPDGNGPSLELIDPYLNNTLPQNWQVSMWHGTPGQKNSFRIVINEINYNSAFDFNPEDWIELYNPSTITIAVSGWHLKDDNNINDFTFPAGTTIAPHGFLIVCYDKTAFQVLFPTLTNIIGDFKFGLNGNGDEVKIYNEYYNLVDSIKYDNDKPWAIEANGFGPTLELLNPELDNAIHQHWQASAGHGSPGQATRALPVVTRFVVKDSSNSTIVTNSRDVLIEMIGYDFDGQVIRWHINESGIPPLPAEFGWENKPTAYHIESDEGDVPIYGWVLDNDNQVSRLTDTSHISIRLMFGGDLYNISGTVNYANKSQPIPDAVMKLTYIYGTGSDTTDENGNFVFADTDTGLVKLKPAKTGDIQNAIRGSDALFILKYLASLTKLTNEEKFAADVTGDGNITDSDVQAILRYLTFYTDNIGNASHWRFVPTDTCFTLNSDKAINFKAYLSGDANLDWNSGSSTGQQTGGDSLNSNVSLKLNQVNTHYKKYLELPLIVEPDSEAVNTILLSLQYDPVYLIYKATETTESSKNFRMEVNGTQAGEIHIAMIDIEGILTKDEVLKIRFEVVDPTIRNRRTQLTFNRALVNDLNVKTLNGMVIFTDTSDIEPLPQDFVLFQNYPNPFNSNTMIQFQIAEPSDIRLRIYNLMGNEVRTIVNERNKSVGSYQVSWNGKDNHGIEMPSGIYMYELRAEGFVKRKKMVMVK